MTESKTSEPYETKITLPPARQDGAMSLERALSLRHSVREFSRTPLSVPEASQLLWATQGITRPEGKRTAPSAGALYPLEVVLVTGNVQGLAPGAWRYDPKRLQLTLLTGGDLRPSLCKAALDQDWMAWAPAILVIAAVFERTMGKYGRRGHQYVLLDAGTAAQNVGLQAVALGLGSAIVGAFRDDDLRQLLCLDDSEVPLLLLPVGKEA